MVVLVALVAAGIFLFVRSASDVFEDGGASFDVDGGGSSFEDVSDYGDDPELDALWDDCGAGDLAACDDLYFTSPFDSAYEAFGATCGRTRDDAVGQCAS